MDPIIWLYIALGIIVLGLIVAVVGVVMLLTGIKEPMKEMKGSADNLKGRMDKLMLETTHLQHTTNELKEDIQQKSEKVAVLVDGAKGTINSVIDMNSVVRSITSGISKKVEDDPANRFQVNQYSNNAAGLMKYLDKQKNQESTNSTYNPEPAAPQQVSKNY